MKLTLGQVADWIHADGEFNDAGDAKQPPLGSVAVCGPNSPPFIIELVVIG